MVLMKYQWAGKISCVAVVCWSELKAASSRRFKKGLNAQGEFVPCADTPGFYLQQDFQASGGAELPKRKQTWSGSKEEPPKYFQNDVIT